MKTIYCLSGNSATPPKISILMRRIAIGKSELVHAALACINFHSFNLYPVCEELALLETKLDSCRFLNGLRTLVVTGCVPQLPSYKQKTDKQQQDKKQTDII